MAERDYSDRSILVMGGSSGIGLRTVAEVAKMGATVYMGTRTPANFERAKQPLGRWGRKEGFDPESLAIYPFYADVTKKVQVEEAAEELRLGGGNLTDVIFSQAGGMELFTRQLNNEYLLPLAPHTLSTPIDELSPNKLLIVEERLAALRVSLEVWNEKAMPYALAVNYQGTFDTLDVLQDVFPHGFRGIYLNSGWGDKSGEEGVEIPLLYGTIDRSKAKARDRFRENGPKLAQLGIPIGIVIASLVNDTQVGKMFNEFLLNLMDKEQRNAVKDSSIQCLDVVHAIEKLLDSDPNRWPAYPNNLYIYKNEGQVVFTALPEQSAMYTHPYRF